MSATDYSAPIRAAAKTAVRRAAAEETASGKRLAANPNETGAPSTIGDNGASCGLNPRVKTWAVRLHRQQPALTAALWSAALFRRFLSFLLLDL
jgi:hypothetical protein